MSPTSGINKAAAARIAAADNYWELDNSVMRERWRKRHRTWRPVRDGRSVYGDAGYPLYTFCGRLIEGYGIYTPVKPRCGVCFRGAAE